MKVIVRFFAILLLLAPANRAAAQTLTGTVVGTITDQSGAVLPGVTATLTGPRGSQTTVSDAKGEYRFVGVLPDAYMIKIELQGFAPQQKEIKLGIDKTATVDFKLAVGGLSEAVEVKGNVSTVDVKSSATENTVSNAMLEMTPLYSSTSTGLLNAAPGINSSSAFGGQGSYGNALLLDGVDTRDPEGGSAWTFFNQYLIDEIQIGGLGAPAEYGGFTGAIINTITKSGGNRYSGLFSMRYSSDSLASKNVTDEILTANPSFGSSAVLKDYKDYTVQIGGPIKQDKAFFFGSVQRYSALSDPTGPIANSTDISPRLNAKFTLQPRPNDNLILGLQYDAYNVTGRRSSFVPASQATDNQTVTEDAPEWVYNAQWRHVFSTSTLVEAKFTGYWGYYYLDPIDPSPPVFDGLTSTYSGGGGGLYYADRDRNQFQATVTKYAQMYGSHTFKFGAEIERSHVRSQYSYGSQPGGFYIYTYGGVPYYQTRYGYDVQGDNRRFSGYAQDQWNLGRATLNIGLRLDRIRGFSPQLDETVYKPNVAWGPRAGVSYNLVASGNAAVKAFWGRYYEGAASGFYTSATPGIQDFTQTPLNSAGQVVGPPDVITPGQVYGIGSDISHPSTDEFNVSYEQQIRPGVRLTATGIYRRGDHFINNVLTDARWRPVTLNNALTGTTFTAYSWANQAASNTSFFIRNQDGFQYLDTGGNVIGTADSKRDYKALMLVLSNALKGNFGYQASYVLSKAEGTVDNNGFGAYLGNNSWNNPNTSLINTFGELTNSRRHELKAFVTYRVPRIDVWLGGNYTGLSGRPYTPFAVYPSSQLSVGSSARRTIFLAPRGSEVNEFTNNIDLRVEKMFAIQGHRFGVYADTTNLFNSSGITAVQAQFPSAGGIAYQAPTAIQGARQVTFGGRWSF